MSPRLLGRRGLLAVLAASTLILTACPAIPFGDPVCNWRVTLSAYQDENSDGVRGEAERPVENARFVVTEMRGGKSQWPKYFGADENGEAVYSLPGVGVCPDSVQVSAEAPAPFYLTTPREVTLAANQASTAAWGFAATLGPAPAPHPVASMSCYTAPVLRGAVTGRLLAPNGDLWVTRIDKDQPVSVLREGVESTLTIPGLSEALDPTLDAEGNLWVAGGVNGGVARYDGNSWRHFTQADGLPADDAFMLETAGGALWAVTWEGPARFDAAEERWQAFPAVRKAFRVLDPGDGSLWFADGATLLRTSATDPGTVLQETRPPTDQTLNAADVIVARGDAGPEIWVAGEMGGQGVLARFSPDTRVWTPYTYETTQGGLPVADLRRLAVLPDRSLFVAARHGGFRFIPGPSGDPLGGTWITYPEFEQQTDASAVRSASDPELISRLVPVEDAAGYERLCKVW